MVMFVFDNYAVHLHPRMKNYYAATNYTGIVLSALPSSMKRRVERSVHYYCYCCCSIIRCIHSIRVIEVVVEVGLLLMSNIYKIDMI